MAESDGILRVRTAIDNSGAREGLKELSDLFDKYADKMDDKTYIEVQKLASEYQKLVDKQKILNDQSDIYGNKIQEIKSKMSKNESIGIASSPELTEELNKASIAFQKIMSESDQTTYKLNMMKTKSDYFVKAWKNANVEIKETNAETKKTHSILSRIERLISKSASGVVGFARNTLNLKNGFSKVNDSITIGRKKLLRYGLALISIRSIYGGLSRLANEFLNSGSDAANQIKENLDYMKSALSNALAPAIELVVNSVMKLMSVLNTVLTTFFGINLFAKNTSKNLSNASKSAKEISKLKAGFDEMETFNSNDSSSGGDSSIAPNVDIEQYDILAEKMKHFFDPIVKAWDSQGKFFMESVSYSIDSVKSLFSSIGESFNNIWQNGTGQKYVEGLIKLGGNLVGIVGDIAKGWNDAWNNAGLGDAIMQSLFDIGINFVELINRIVEKFREWIQSIDWTPVLNGVLAIGQGINLIIDCIMNGDWSRLGRFLSDTFHEIVNGITEWIRNVDWVQLGLDIAHFIYDGLIEIINFITSIDWVQLLTDIGELCVEGLCAGLAMLGSVVVGLFNDMVEGIKQFLGIHSPSTVFKYIGLMIFEGLKNGLLGLVSWVKGIFDDAWKNICETFSINNVSNFFSQVANEIQSIFSNIPQWFENKFSAAWQKVKDVFSSGGEIFDGIKDGIVNSFRIIVNGIIDGINKAITWPFNKINSILNWIKTYDFGWPIGQPFYGFWGFNPLYVPQIPKLAKGGIVNRATQVVIGEAGKEAVLPLENNTEWMQQLADMIGNNNDDETVINLYVDGERLFKWFVKKKKQKEFAMNGG